MKTSPCIICGDRNELAAFKSININLDEYEHSYMNSPLPEHMELTEKTIKLMLSNNEYIPVVHLFNDIRIEQEMERRVSAHIVQREFIQGKTIIVWFHLLNELTMIDNNDIQNIFEFDLNLSSNNNKILSTCRAPLLPIDDIPLSSSSPHTEMSYLFSSLFKSNSTVINEKF